MADDIPQSHWIDHYTKLRADLVQADVTVQQCGDNERLSFAHLTGWTMIDVGTPAPYQAVAWTSYSDWKYRARVEAFSGQEQAQAYVRSALSRKLKEDGAALVAAIDAYLERVGAGPEKPAERSDPGGPGM